MTIQENHYFSQSILLDVEGMKCGACVRSVEKTLLSQTNVSKASVNLVTKTAWLDLFDSTKPLEPILKALSDRGFEAKERNSTLSASSTDQEQLNQTKEWWKQWRQLLIAITLLLLSVLGHLVEGGKIVVPLIGDLRFHAALATLSLIGPGLPILKNGTKAALSFAPTMDTLVGLGVTSAYIASLIAWIFKDVGWPCFFNEPVMLLGFVLLGRFLEERARFRTGKAIKQLAQLQPETARLLIGNGDIREIRVGALKPGETIQLLAGDRIPIDGIVLEGNSAVDISSLTGEPIPLEAEPGVELVAGSLNLQATLLMEVKKVGSETALARIIRLVEEAQSRKAPIQGLADKVAGKFCYGVVSLSLVTFFFWWKLAPRLWPNLINLTEENLMSGHVHGAHATLGMGAETWLGLSLQLAIAVLVVACPCALGLATPTVITVSSGIAAKKGWLFRGGDIIEKASYLKQIIFDKTGTLTIGRPLVSRLIESPNPQKMLQIAASVEANSRHPIAYAILQESQKNGLKTLNCNSSKTYPGQGISGKLDEIEDTIYVGKPEWIQETILKAKHTFTNQINDARSRGEIVVAVASKNNLLGLIAIDDKVRSDVNIAIKRLRESGLKLTLLSGDRHESVQRLGKQLDFELSEMGWEMMPEDKLKRIERLKPNGFLAMVRDGINDAPALAAADIGIAIGTGTQIAQDSSDIVLLGDRIEALPDALILAKKTMKKIKQNLYWAFGYNLIALPIAAGALLPGFGLLLSPPIAALLMALSSITVVLNALSLQKA